MDIRLFRKEDTDQVANLIARLNRLPQHHICYLGTDPDEIKHALDESLTDLPAEKAILVADEDGAIVGTWGLEIDSSRGRCYMWGPFVDHDDWRSVAQRLQERLPEIIPKGTSWFQMGLERENVNAAKVAEDLGYTLCRERGYTMRLPRGNFKASVGSRILAVDTDTRSRFAELHDQLFPTTYYNGAELMERLNETRRVWITEDKLGYVYVECKPDHGWASLEFVGVDEKARGNGYGKSLVAKACEWLFTHPKIEEVELAVSGENPAIGFYKSVGFVYKHEIHVYEKEL